MRQLLVLSVLALSSLASAQTCAVVVKGMASLPDAHHVKYTVTVSNPTARPIAYIGRIDFFLKGKKIDGGFETLRGTIPARGKKVFTGSEPFVESLKGVDAVKVTKVRSCKVL